MTANWYTIYNIESGEIEGSLTSDEECLVVNVPQGSSAILGDHAGGYVLDGGFVSYTPEQSARKAARPGRNWRWSNTSMGWDDLRGLGEAKAEKWTEIKAAREASINAPLWTAYGTVDADAKSRAAIADLVLMGGDAVVEFTLANNNSVWLVADQLRSILSDLHERTQSAHKTARLLRAQIESATTAQQLESIAW